MVIESHKSAMFRTKISQPMRCFIEKCPEVKSILDYGCGRGFDFRELQSLGYGACGFDPFFQRDVPDKKFDAVTIIYVLNVISTVQERMSTLRQAYGLVNPGGTLFVAVRAWGEVNRAAKKGAWKSMSDGYVTKANTFQRGFTQYELNQLFEKALSKSGKVGRNKFVWGLISYK